MTIIEKIKAEIERKRDQNRKSENSYYDVNDIKNAGICRHRRILCEELLSFLSTLESEKPMNQEGLEKELSRYLQEECSGDDEPSISEIARHFAQWGAEHLATSGKTLEIKPGDEVTINGHKIVYDKDKGYVTIAKSEESVPNDLKEAADNHIRKVVDAAGHPGWDWTTQDIADAFIAGAKWQYQKDREEFAKIKAKTWSEGFDACKAQMMREVVEGVVNDFGIGDNVRIIVLPKED